jgi:hypothetical protein
LQGFSFSQQGWDPANLHREKKSECEGKENSPDRAGDG